MIDAGDGLFTSPIMDVIDGYPKPEGYFDSSSSSFQSGGMPAHSNPTGYHNKQLMWPPHFTPTTP